jgi:hypothetical protein
VFFSFTHEESSIQAIAKRRKWAFIVLDLGLLLHKVKKYPLKPLAFVDVDKMKSLFSDVKALKNQIIELFFR